MKLAIKTANNEVIAVQLDKQSTNNCGLGIIGRVNWYDQTAMSVKAQGYDRSYNSGDAENPSASYTQYTKEHREFLYKQMAVLLAYNFWTDCYRGTYLVTEPMVRYKADCLSNGEFAEHLGGVFLSESYGHQNSETRKSGIWMVKGADVRNIITELDLKHIQRSEVSVLSLCDEHRYYDNRVIDPAKVESKPKQEQPVKTNVVDPRVTRAVMQIRQQASQVIRTQVEETARLRAEIRDEQLRRHRGWGF